MAGRPSVWAGQTGQMLVLDAKPGLEAGGSRDDVIRTLRTRPPWDKWSQETLLRKYREALRHHGDSPPPITADEMPPEKMPAKQPAIDATARDRWLSLLQKWGAPLEEARSLVNRLIAVTAAAQRVSQLGQLFEHMDRRRHWRGRQKIAWLHSAADRIKRNPTDWPIPHTRRGRPDVQAGLVLAALRKGLTEKSEIAAETGIKWDSLQTLLNCLRRSKEIKSTGRGRYAEFERSDLPTYERPDVDKTILKELAHGPATPPELRARIGCTKGGIAKGLRRLRKAGKIVLVQRARSAERGNAALYAPAGTAAPYAFVQDAVVDALQSGSKTVPELSAATGRNPLAIWEAIRHLEDKGVVRRVGFRGRFTVIDLAVKRGRSLRAAPLSAHPGRN